MVHHNAAQRRHVPSFSANGTNAAKNTTVTFTSAGTYGFTVSIVNSGGLSTSSSVTVTVSQTLASIQVTPFVPYILTGGTQQFSATGLDQFGKTMATQPAVAWGTARARLPAAAGC